MSADDTEGRREALPCSVLLRPRRGAKGGVTGLPLRNGRNAPARVPDFQTNKTPRFGLLQTASRGGIQLNVGGAQSKTIASRHRLRSEEHTSELQSLRHLVCRLL